MRIVEELTDRRRRGRDVADRRGSGRGRDRRCARGDLRRRRRRAQPRNRPAGKASQLRRAGGRPARQHRAARGDGTGQRTGRDPRRRRPGRAVGGRGVPGPHHPHDLGGGHRLRHLRNGRAARRHAARDVRRSGAGRGDPRRELGQARRGRGVPGPRLRVTPGRLDRDDRHRRRAGRPGHRRSQAAARTPARAGRRCSAWSTRVRTLRDDINPMFYRALAVVADPADRLDGAAAVHLPTPAGDELDRRAVLHHRDHRHRRLRRLQLHRPADLAADCGASG